jgi:4-hydroxyphenylpyruvate dioxygenase
MDGFVLFYGSIFGLEPQPLWELADPYGMVRSRAMVSGDGSIRLSLNVCESSVTATGRFVNTSAGAGVHHVAFETDDIRATLEQLVARGVPMVPIPSNYYDDLAARRILDPERLSDFAALNILYDRDDNGEFLHAYTGTFDGRFFFEFVQRGDYRGFGAVNAPVRIAAQAASHETGLASRVVML